jgi:uncharacterized protein
MMFWDSSAIVPLLVNETSSKALGELLRQDDEMIVWWGSETECVSALARLERDSALDSRSMRTALERLDALESSWIEVEAVPAVRQTARRLLRVHPIRAADALQLAAAFLAAEGQPSTLGFVCLDERLSTAADREGFELPWRLNEHR